MITETRIYVIDLNDERVEDIDDVMALTDEEFMFEAEQMGTVYTVAGFMTAFNNGEVNTATDVIRMIDVPNHEYRHALAQIVLYADEFDYDVWKQYCENANVDANSITKLRLYFDRDLIDTN